MKFVSASVALFAAGAAMAQSGTARFGLKGGKFDVNGFAANGLDVFGFDNSGKDAWGRPIHDQTAGLVAPVGKANTAKYNPTTTTAAATTTTTKAHTKAKPVQTPTPTPFHTPTYTTLFQGGTSVVVPVVESTVVWPMDTVTRTVVETHSIAFPTEPITPLVPRPHESPKTSCYGGIVTFTVTGNCATQNNNFEAHMYLAEVAWFTETQLSDWEIINTEYDAATQTSTITTVTCSKWAYDTLVKATITPGGDTGFSQTKFATTNIKACNTGPTQPYHSAVTNCYNHPVSATKSSRRAVRGAECAASEFLVDGRCHKCAPLPGCQAVACSQSHDSVCTSCKATLAVSSIGACN